MRERGFLMERVMTVTVLL